MRVKQILGAVIGGIIMMVGSAIASTALVVVGGGIAVFFAQNIRSK